MGLSDNEAMLLLFGVEVTEEEEQRPTKITKPVFGPLITTFYKVAESIELNLSNAALDNYAADRTDTRSAFVPKTQLSHKQREGMALTDCHRRSQETCCA